MTEDEIRKFVKRYPVYQRFEKQKKKKYSKILPKSAEFIPWDVVY